MSAASITPLLGVADSATVQRALQSGGKRPNAAAAAEQNAVPLDTPVEQTSLLPLPAAPSAEMLTLPWIGPIDLAAQSLLLSTVLIAFVPASQRL